jgi:DNA replication protein DnaD
MMMKKRKKKIIEYQMGLKPLVNNSTTRRNKNQFNQMKKIFQHNSKIFLIGAQKITNNKNFKNNNNNNNKREV